MKEVDPESGARAMSSGSLLNASGLRNLVVFVIGGLTVLLVVWMVQEKGYVRSCGHGNELELSRVSPVPNASAPAPKIYIQMPKPNITDHTAWDYNWDKKAWKTQQEAEGVGTRTILLVRHGQYHFNSGHLTELGQKQANLTGMRLREMNMPYKHIIHSTLPRAEETARIISQHLPGVPLFADDIIREGGPVQPKPTVNYWSLPDRDYFVDGPRLEAAFRKYFYRADKQQTQQSFEILVGHGNIFKFFALRAIQLPPEAWMRVFIGHASITQVNIFPDGVVNMDHFGDTGYMPANYFTV